LKRKKREDAKASMATHLIMSLIRFAIDSHVHTGNKEMLVNWCI
jgi:hypothetical protein